METADGKSILNPGEHSKAHTDTLHQNVASSLSEVQGSAVSPSDLAPAASQTPVFSGSGIETEKEGFHLDLEDIIAGEKGKPRTNPSRNFLRTLILRLKKKNPDSTIREK